MNTGIAKREPALVTMAALWLLANIGSLVVQRWGWMGSDQWSTLTAALVPLVSAAVAAAAGWLLRRVVSPAWRWLEDEAPMVADVIDTHFGVDEALAAAEAIFPGAKPDPKLDPEPEPAE